MTKKYIFILLLILSYFPVTASGDSSNVNERKYYRSECIVAVEVIYVNQEAKYINQVNNTISKKLHQLVVSSGDFKNAYAYTIDKKSPKQSFYYLQFLDNCEHRIDLAKAVMNIVWNPKTSSASYHVLRKKIEPSLNTIEIDGAWIDKSKVIWGS